MELETWCLEMNEKWVNLMAKCERNVYKNNGFVSAGRVSLPL